MKKYLTVETFMTVETLFPQNTKNVQYLQYKPMISVTTQSSQHSKQNQTSTLSQTFTHIFW